MTERKTTILAVDDTPVNLTVLKGILGRDYDVITAANGLTALQLAAHAVPDLILLDVMMPDMNGFQVCRSLKLDPKLRNIPVIFVTSMNEIEDEAKGFEAGCVDYITKPVSPSIVKQRVRIHLALYDQNRALEERVRERTAELDRTRLMVIHRLGRAAEYRDNETGMHVIRMSHYSRAIALAAGLTQDEADLLLLAAPMHDVGKIGIPDGILLKADKLNDDEWATMQHHPEYGAEIIGETDDPLFVASREIAHTHHEKWNGKGYPRALAGGEIPFFGRIVAVADVFDALTTERPYKKAWSVDDALTLIRREREQHFDPRIVDTFFGILPQIMELKETYGEDKQSLAA